MRVYDRLGRAAIRFALVYLRRRYRRQLRIGIGVGSVVTAAAVTAFLARRNPPEG